MLREPRASEELGGRAARPRREPVTRATPRRRLLAAAAGPVRSRTLSPPRGSVRLSLLSSYTLNGATAERVVAECLTVVLGHRRPRHVGGPTSGLGHPSDRARTTELGFRVDESAGSVAALRPLRVGQRRHADARRLRVLIDRAADRRRVVPHFRLLLQRNEAIRDLAETDGWQDYISARIPIPTGIGSSRTSTRTRP